MSSIGNRSIIQGLCLCCLGTVAAATTTVDNGGTTAASVHRRLDSSDMFVDLYQPTTMVDGTALIDKDIRTIYSRTILGTQDALDEAESIFLKGAFSDSYAQLTLVDSLLTEIKAGTHVTGTTTAGSETKGHVYEDAKVGDTKLKIVYDEPYSCYIGGLSEPVRDHCK